MSNVEEKGRFDPDKVTIINDSEESLVVSRTSLIQRGGLLKNFLIVCSNEMKFILRLLVTRQMLDQFARYLEDEVIIFTSADNGFLMYLFSKRYFITQLQKICHNFLKDSVRNGNVCRIHDLASRHKERQLQYQCYKQFSFSDNNIFCSDDFLSSEETTVFKLLACPAYVNLNEFALFIGLSLWVKRTFLKLRKTNSEISMTEVASPFLPLIRFFTIELEHLKQIIHFSIVVKILTKGYFGSIKEYHERNNVAKLPLTISANVILRNITDYSSFIAVSVSKGHKLKRNKCMTDNLSFLSDIWVPENCYVVGIKLPVIHCNPRKIKVLVGVKSAYSQSFLYERSVCDKHGMVQLKTVKLLPKRSFHVFSVKILKDDIDSNNITVEKHTGKYYQFYNFGDTIGRKEEKRRFQCKIAIIF
ncbi:uncharacterized protein LOC111640241 [Centruroides sculpturatus]|uniref:uncharacterized protein LOC111640241 n=1 Tax=Centruroides sculpturatus TaxID=218467 RepID=UPI000C6EE0B9|nr:uncharacterized protein LOC111640241 [Centruroides sculpturatus]